MSVGLPSADSARWASPSQSAPPGVSGASSSSSSCRKRRFSSGGWTLRWIQARAGAGPKTERPVVALWVGGQGAQEVVDLLERDAALEAQRGDAVAVEPPGEVAEEGVPRVGRHAGDDQLVPRDADRQRVAGGEEGFEPVDEPLGGFLEMGVAQRVHRALVQHDGELDEKIRQVPRQGRGGARPGSLGEGREPLWDRAHGMWPVIVGPK